LNSGREDILVDNDWNKEIKRNFSDLFKKAIEGFKECDSLKHSYYRYIPIKSEISDSFFQSVVDDFHSTLKEYECVITESGKWVKPNDVFRPDQKIRKIISNNDVLKKFNREFLHSKNNISDEIQKVLGIARFDLDELLQFLSDEEWLNQKNDEWFTDLYLYLHFKLPYIRTFKSINFSISPVDKLKSCKIIRLENGTLSSINAQTVFFPLSSGKTYGFENDLDIIKKSLIKNETDENQAKIREVLKELGLKDSTPIQIIDEHIIKKCQERTERIIKDKAASPKFVGYLNYIKDNFKDYSIEKKDLKALHEVWIKTDNKDEDVFKKPSDLYLSSKYNNKYNLDSFFETISDVFVSDSYLGSIESDVETINGQIAELSGKLRNKSNNWFKKNKKDVKNWKKSIIKLSNDRDEKIAHRNQESQKESETWKSFFLKIGVNETPRIIKKHELLYTTNTWPYLSTESNSLYLKHNVLPDISQIHRTRDISIDDWILSPEIEKQINYGNFEKITRYLQILDERWATQYSNYSNLIYRYFYCTEKSIRYESSFIYHIKNLKVPSSNNQLEDPHAVFLIDENTKAVLGNSVLYLSIPLKNQELIKILGLKTEATVQNVLGYLKSLSNKKPTDQISLEKQHVIKIYSYLEEHYIANSYLIRTEFTNHKLLYIPDSPKIFYTLHEVFWNDVSDIFKDYRISLEQHYPQFKSFFVDMIGINVKPNPKLYADLLEDLSKKPKIDETDNKNIRIIFAELNKHLNPEKEEEILIDKPWWKEFIQKKIFLADDGKFHKHDDGILLNDSADISEKFKNEDGLAFLIIKGKDPKYKHFLNATNIPRLSESYHIKLEETGNEIINENFNNAFNERKIFILQYIYNTDNEGFEELKKSGKIQKIVQLQAFSVNTLKIRYVLKNNIKSTINDYPSFFDGNKLLLAEDWEDNTAEIAEEIKRYLDLDEKFEEELEFILNSKLKKIEKRFKKKGHISLPEEELKWIKPLLSSEDSSGLIPAVNPPTPPPGPPTPTPPVPPGDEVPPPPPPSSPPPGPTGGGNVPDTGGDDWEPEVGPTEIDPQEEKYKPLPTETTPSGPTGPGTGGGGGGGPSPHRSSKALKTIGRWGERYAFEGLKKNFKKKYPNNKQVEENGLFRILYSDGSALVEIQWLNYNQETQHPYDIRILNEGKTEFIEVKTTTLDQMDWVDFTSKELEHAKLNKDNYFICRVSNAGSSTARYKLIPNVIKLLNEDPSRVRISHYQPELFAHLGNNFTLSFPSSSLTFLGTSVICSNPS
jgi:hypothetical protein